MHSRMHVAYFLLAKAILVARWNLTFAILIPVEQHSWDRDRVSADLDFPRCWPYRSTQTSKPLTNEHKLQASTLSKATDVCLLKNAGFVNGGS